MARTIQLSETELVNLINKVINEAETANCKCCNAGVRPVTGIGNNNPNYEMFVAAEKQRVLECCKGCKDEGGMISNDGIRRVSR
jgi:hypothetical protein